MKKVYLILTAMLSAAFVFTACTDNTPFSTATSEDDPRIIDPTFPDRVNGELPVVTTLTRDTNFEMEVTVTPADYTTLVWYLDGAEIHQGNELDISLLAGTYTLKIVATTTVGKTTSREGLIQVNPLPDDPSTTTVASERFVSPDAVARLYGTNLDKVKSVVIGGQDIAATYNASEGSIEYTVPSNLTDGEYRISLVDAAGNEYGADKIVATSSALVTTGITRATIGSEWTLTGINLDIVTSLKLGDATITDFVSQSAGEIVVVTPAIAEGNQTLTGTTSGGALRFYVGGALVEEATVAVSAETILWEGLYEVRGWSSSSIIDKSKFTNVSAGSTLSVYYTIAGDGDHTMRLVTTWWTALESATTPDPDNNYYLSGDGVQQIVLTQGDLNLIAEQSFLCTGDGYNVTKVTVK